MTCSTLELTAQWVLGDLPEAEARTFEHHYFECEYCFEQALRMQQLVEELQVRLPPELTLERRRRLEAARPYLPAVEVQPGERAQLRLAPSAEIGVWVMRAPLQQAARVDIEARDASGALFFALSDVPFDGRHDEVVLACQMHPRAATGCSELHVRLTATEPGGARRHLGDYVLDHLLEAV